MGVTGKDEKKIGILTFLHNQNFGSSLQAYALQRVIGEMGYVCEHIDYQPSGKEKLVNLLSSGNHWELVAEGIRKRLVRRSHPEAREKSRAIPAFYERRMKLSPRCADREDLKRQSEEYDILIAGSDQIWNPVWLNPAYFLRFAPEGIRKVAYAPSLGVRTLPGEAKARKIRSWVSDFSAISIREEEGAVLMEKITGSRPTVMPDPVLLLSQEEWAGVAAAITGEAPYLLCYFIGENGGYWDAVRKLQDERHLRAVVLPVTQESFQQGFPLLDGAGPEEFLGAVRGAEMICTDSFHCLAFSRIFGKECRIIRRDREEDPNSKNSRIDSFERIWDQEGPQALREKGRAWLQEQLNA